MSLVSWACWGGLDGCAVGMEEVDFSPMMALASQLVCSIRILHAARARSRLLVQSGRSRSADVLRLLADTTYQMRFVEHSNESTIITLGMYDKYSMLESTSSLTAFHIKV